MIERTGTRSVLLCCALWCVALMHCYFAVWCITLLCVVRCFDAFRYFATVTLLLLCFVVRCFDAFRLVGIQSNGIPIVLNLI